MLPLYGAATPRQDIGNLADTTYPMLSLLGPWGFLKSGLQGIDTRAKLMDKEALLDQAQDPYVTFREAYFQNLEQTALTAIKRKKRSRRYQTIYSIKLINRR